MDQLRRRYRLPVVIAVALVLVLAVATGAVATQLLRNGGKVTAVRTATSDEQWQVSSASYTDVPGMTTTVTVAPKTKGLLVITFSADILALDLGGGTPGLCWLHATVNGVDAPPSEVFSWAYDPTASDGKGDERTGSMQWVYGPLSPGTYTVSIQAKTTDATYDMFYVRDRTLTVLRSRV